MSLAFHVFSGHVKSRYARSGLASLRSPSDKAVRLKLCHQIELIVLKTERDIVGQLYICEQTPAIARPGHRSREIIFFENVQSARHLRRIRDGACAVN